MHENEDNTIPNRFTSLDETVLKYALTSNSITYMMRIEKGQMTFRKPQNISTVAEFCELLKARYIFVELFSDREANNMIAAQFSRDEMIRYDGWEKGREENQKNIIVNMYNKNYTLEQIADISDMSIEKVKEIISSH